MEKKELNKTQRKDLFYLDPRVLTIEDGFNVRTDYGDLDQLKLSIVENGVKIPLRGYKIYGKNEYVVVDGHRRFMAVMMAIKEGNDIARVPFITEEKKTAEERNFEMILSNDGKQLTPLELGEVYKRLQNYGYSPSEISRRIGKSVTHVIDMIDVAGSSKDVKDAIKEGSISTTLVSEVKKSIKDQDQAEEVIKTSVQIKKEEGAKKVTKKDLKGIVPEKKKDVKKEMESEGRQVFIDDDVNGDNYEKVYSDTKTYIEVDVAELLKKQINECAKNVPSAFRKKVLMTSLVI